MITRSMKFPQGTPVGITRVTEDMLLPFLNRVMPEIDLMKIEEDCDSVDCAYVGNRIYKVTFASPRLEQTAGGDTPIYEMEITRYANGLFLYDWKKIP